MRITPAEEATLRRLANGPVSVAISSGSSGIPLADAVGLIRHGLARKVASSSVPGQVGLGRRFEITPAGRQALAALDNRVDA